MTRRRFYAPPESFADEGRRVVLSAEETRHLRDVLRVREGEEVGVFDGEGREFLCRVGAPGRGREASLEVCERVEPPRPESPLSLTLAVALLKGEKFDLVVQKATELGAASVIPVVTRRADVRLKDANDAARRVERWRRLALEAAKQSGRARVPRISGPAPFESLVARGAGENELRIFFSERGGGRLSEVPGAAVDEGSAGGPSELTALVGPEGGWEDEEIELARSAGWRVVTLGGRTLRAETAAVAAAALLQHLYGDLN
ncbi:MAG TPA: 16S rRNA (uracil(1498)-N(3))-methyltransferase [Pyrinomonadaceae bacterium]|nr:16S rRNA (uracil(1498)-N(3))-methyltransferase [Pyrinomonadaceae bacterium]